METQQAIMTLTTWKNCEQRDSGCCRHKDADIYCEYGCWSISEVNEAVDTAISALEHQQQCGECKYGADPRALTLEELYQVDNQPLYFHCTVGNWHLNGWHIVKPESYSNHGFKDLKLDRKDNKVVDTINYGITWLAYDRQPKMELLRMRAEIAEAALAERS